MHLLEISDEPWCPRGIRYAVTDYCRFVTEVSGAFNPVAPLLAKALEETKSLTLLDLASGAGGPWRGLQPLLRELGHDTPVCLTDYFPNREALERTCRLSHETIHYHPKPVDATQVPAELTGFRTMFSAFHHFRPAQARAVLADAVARGEGIGVFECANRHILTLLACLLGTPLRVLIATPFILPFRLSRLFWTYLVPVVPLVLALDTFVSCLRIYSVPELRELTEGLEGYRWDIGITRGKRLPIPITYLIGMPLHPRLAAEPNAITKTRKDENTK
jgi:hypothetical protein